MKIQDVTLSFSSLKQFSRSPAHWVEYKKENKKKPSAVMRRGTLAHLLVLEPEKQIDLQIIDCKTKASKEFKSAVEQYDKPRDTKVYTRKEFDEALNLAESIMAHPLANKLVSEATEVEKHVNFRIDNVDFHGYIDVLGHDYIADIKITDNEPKKMQRWVLDNLYHMQLAMYSNAVFLTQNNIKHYLITCDPNAPYGVVVYQMSSKMLNDGYNCARLEVQMFKEWYRGWDGKTAPKSYDYLEALNGPMMLDLPNWYK
jgi:hypothetical protein